VDLWCNADIQMQMDGESGEGPGSGSDRPQTLVGSSGRLAQVQDASTICGEQLYSVVVNFTLPFDLS
jgi:hypothetical protein